MYAEPDEPMHVRQPCSADPTIAQFFAALTPRQIKVAALHLDGLTQDEIVEKLSDEEIDIDRSTVSRDIAAVRATCQRYGKTLPEPLRVHARDERQMPEGLVESL